MSDPADERPTPEELSARLGREAGTRGGAFIRRYGRAFEVAAVALLILKVLGLFPLSWPLTILLALAIALLYPAIYGLIVGLQLRIKYAEDLAATHPEERTRG